MLRIAAIRAPAGALRAKRCSGIIIRERECLRIPLCCLQATQHHWTCQRRPASTSSSTRWKTRQANDSYAREAKLAGLKSRAAFKLLEINEKYRLFRRGDTVVDLGYAPGSWSQVAVNRTQPGGRVVGIDLIPAQPPRGVSTLQGDFLSPEIREEVREFVLDPARGRMRDRHSLTTGEGAFVEELEAEGRTMVELERAATEMEGAGRAKKVGGPSSQKELDLAEGRVVNVVLSDMCEPWPLASSTWIKSVSNPWRRMMNTSGMAFRDHAGSMVKSTDTSHVQSRCCTNALARTSA